MATEDHYSQEDGFCDVLSPSTPFQKSPDIIIEPAIEEGSDVLAGQGGTLQSEDNQTVSACGEDFAGLAECQDGHTVSSGRHLRVVDGVRAAFGR